MTYSILGWAKGTGDLGVALQSRFAGVGSPVPHGESEVEVVATQGFGDPQHGPSGSPLWKCGPSELLPTGPEPAVELTGLMAAPGTHERPPDGTWDEATRRRWELVLGSGKYDDRINDGEAVDLEILADLRCTYGRRPAG
jgi:hypothetical protein